MASIEIENDGPVRVIVINNPDKRNAFSGAMGQALDAALQQADSEASVRAVVVTGAGDDAFSSGHDLADVLKEPETASDPVANAGFTRPARMATPVVAAVNGVAYAAGFILALNCDLRVAGSNAKFCAVGARIGLVPVGGQLSRILNVVSYPAAFRLLSTAVPMSASEAQNCGLASAVVEPSDTVSEAVRLARTISEVSPAVVQAIKAGLAKTLHDGLDAGIRAEVELANAVRSLPDGNEGVSAFLDRRPASYPDAPGWLTDECLKSLAR